MWRGALPFHVLEITSINLNRYRHFRYTLCYAKCYASHFTHIIFMYPVSSLKILQSHIYLHIIQMNDDDDDDNGGGSPNMFNVLSAS